MNPCVCPHRSADGDRPDRETGEGQPRHGHLHHHEPGLRGPIQSSRQLEEAVPFPRHDTARSTAHRPGHAVFAGFPYRRETLQQDRTFLCVGSLKFLSILLEFFVKGIFL